MAAAVVVNVAQFAAIDAQTRHNYKAIHRYESADLFEIAIRRDMSSRLRVAPFYYLGVLFPDSTLVVPEDGINVWFPLETAAVAFGEVTSIERIDYDPVTFLDTADLDPYRVPTESFAVEPAHRTLDERVAYYVDGAPAGTVLVLTPDGPPDREQPIAFVDISALDEQARARLGRS
jgi:hypothetical protein